MSKNKNSKTQTEAEADLAAKRLIDPSEGNDPEPPTVEAATENRPVCLEKQIVPPGQAGEVFWLRAGEQDSFPTESAAWEWAEANSIEGRLRTVIVLDTRTATVETVKKVTWA